MRVPTLFAFVVAIGLSGSLSACATEAITSVGLSDVGCGDNRSLGQYNLPLSTVGFDVIRDQGEEDDDDDDIWTFSLAHELVPSPRARYLACFEPSFSAFDKINLEISEGLLGSAQLETDAQLEEISTELGDLIGAFARKDAGGSIEIRYDFSQSNARFSLADIHGGQGFAVIGRRVVVASPDRPAGTIYGVVISEDVGSIAADYSGTPSLKEEGLYYPATTSAEFMLYAIACEDGAPPSLSAGMSRQSFESTFPIDPGQQALPVDPNDASKTQCVRLSGAALSFASQQATLAIADPSQILAVEFIRGIGSEDRTTATFTGGLPTRVEIDNQGAIMDVLRFIPNVIGIGRDGDSSGTENEDESGEENSENEAGGEGEGGD